MATYGKTTQGATGWWSCESRYCTLSITLPGGEPIVASYAWLRSQGSATNGLRMGLYNQSDDSLAYSSDVLAGFTDTTGAFKTFTWPSTTPAAGQYRLGVVGDAIAGGGNTAELAYLTVAANAAIQQEYFYTGSWPALEADLTGLEVPLTTREGSIYLETTSGGGGPTPGRRMMLMGIG